MSETDDVIKLLESCRPSASDRQAAALITAVGCIVIALMGILFQVENIAHSLRLLAGG